MANRYWVGGTANWDGTAGSKWALTSGGAGGQAVPTSVDNVFFDAASGAVTCTISTGNTGADNLNCTGFTGTLAGSGNLDINGNITLVAGMTYTHTGRISISSSGTQTIRSAGNWNVRLGTRYTTAMSSNNVFLEAIFFWKDSFFRIHIFCKPFFRYIIFEVTSFLRKFI
jgi:hypothetical protein